MQLPGLNLDFLFGRGYLSTQHHRVGEWATVESMRMEIPDLTFPFDARGGVGRFRNTRCQLRQLRLVLSETGLDSALARAVGEIQGFEELRVRFVDGAAHAQTRVRTLGSDTFLTFKIAAIPPEPPRGDALHIFLHDVRPYGPLPYPARLLVAELVSRLMQSSALLPSGTGPAFDVTLEGDLVELRPIKLCLVQMFPRFGWKLPAVAGLRFESVTIQPGSMTLAARGDERPWERDERPTDALALTASTRAGAAALAAYEARDLLRDADHALFDGQVANAIDTLRALRERYGLHPAIADGLLDALLAVPGPGHVAEAQGIVDELLRADPLNLRAHLAAPTLCLLRGDSLGAIRAYQLLADLLRDRGEQADLSAALLAAAMVQRRHDPPGAIKLLREVTRHAPRNRIALELLRDLYAQTDEVEARVDVLRQLASLYADRDALLDVYQQLAELLMERRHDLAEARLFLEKILRLDPGHLQALFTLGESYVLDEQPLRAIRAFGSAARAAQARGDVDLAARLHVKCAELWRALGDFGSALLDCRRALAVVPAHRRGLELAVELARDHGSVEEVLTLLDQLLPLVETAVERAAGPAERADAADEARRVHAFAADVYHRRGRPDTAAAHHRKALAWRRVHDALAGPAPGAAPDPSVEYLDTYYRQMGKPEDLIELYESELEHGAPTDARRAAWHRTLATIFDATLGLGSEAAEHLRRALDLDPDDDVARDALVELLTRRQRHFELRDVLTDLLPRVRARRARARVLLELGHLHLRPDAIPDAAEAARRLREAQTATPADPDVARALVDAERRVLDANPFSEDAARLLLRALERLAEVADATSVRVDALVQAGDLAVEQLHRPQDALGLYRRALVLDDAPLVAERVARVTRLLGLEPPTPSKLRLAAAAAPPPDLDDIVDDISASLQDEARHLIAPEPRPMPRAPRRELPPTRPNPLLQRTPAPTPPSASSSPAVIPQPEQNPPAEPAASGTDLDAFRAKLLEATTRKAPLANTVDIARKLGRTPSAASLPAIPPRPEDAADTRPSIAAALGRGGRRFSAAPDEDQDDARDDPDATARAPLTLSALIDPAPAPAPAPAPTPPPPAPPLRDTVLARAASLRERNDPAALREGLAALLATPDLDADIAARLHRDLGMSLYFDQEDAAAAAPHLIDARRLDPGGIGREFDLLSALEGVYEDLNDPRGLLDIYGAKLDAAVEPDMKVVFGLLKAELLWERLGRPDDARDALQAVLAIRPHSEPALRMLADIRHAAGDVEGALDLLRQIAGREPRASFERLEALRELGRTLTAYADDLDATDPAAAPRLRAEAVEVFRALIDESPGESEPTLRLRAVLERLERWDDAVALLGAELGTLLGTPGAFPQGPPDDLDPAAIRPALAVPASQIITDAADMHRRAGHPARAIALYGLATRTWSENVDALNARIELLRARLASDDPDLDRARAASLLVDDLRALNALLWAPADRFQALVDAAEVALMDLDDRTRALALLDDALASAPAEPDADLVGRIDAAREMVRSLREPPPPSVPEPEPEPPELLAPPDPIALPPPAAPPILAPAEGPSLLGERRDDFGVGDRLSASIASLLNRAAPQAPVLPRRARGPIPLPPPQPPQPPAPEPADSSIDSGWLDADEAPLDPFLDPLPDDLASSTFEAALKQVERANHRRDRAAYLDALADALTKAAPASASPAVRRGLLTWRAEALLGLRPHAAPPHTPSEDDARQALAAAARALTFSAADEPDAHIAKARALHALGRHAEALDVLANLATLALTWAAELDPDDLADDSELEERIATAALDILAALGDASARTRTIGRLRAANPRMAAALDAITPES